jgi:DNA-binding NtrC family response regulator/tetratricopeptide (TPR) repeat protein
MLGLPERALQAADALRQEAPPREAGRIALLSGQAKLQLGDIRGSFREAKDALSHFPKSVPYYRTRARLLQAEILLKAPHIGEAGPFITDALVTAREHFYFPLLARAYAFKGRWLSLKGNHSKGRVYCLRALQVAREVERPGLKAEIYRTLGKIEGNLGRREEALEWFDFAIQILKERSLRLSKPRRRAFIKAFIEPIEAERTALKGKTPPRSPRFLIQVRDLTSSLADAESPGRFADALLNNIIRVSPQLSANLFLQSEQDMSFRIVATRGRCRRSGRHLLGMASAEVPILTEQNGCAMGLSLSSQNTLRGYLYVERADKRISEVEYDFLTSIAKIANLCLNRTLGSQPSPTAPVSGLSLADGRQIVGADPSMIGLFQEIEQIAPFNANVLIEGETGTGKELVAKAIHEKSGRRRGPWMPLNCSALPADLIESELFGYLRGSFTGAISDKKGLFEAASGGTLFLDEVGTMPLSLQSRFLRVLEEKKIRRIGDTRERSIDTRVVAATNSELSRLVDEEQFRADLYHRLNVFRIVIPPLRNRLSDVPKLCWYFLSRFDAESLRTVSLTQDAISCLMRYDFPGNVRELRNMLENLYFRSRDGLITAGEVTSRLIERKKSRSSSKRNRIQSILDDLVSGRGNFWELVRDPFLNRDLSREDVRAIVEHGLAICNGRYRQLVEYFGLGPDDYKRFLAFLSNHDCKVDFRPFRK